MGKVVTVSIDKGGSAKTTTVVNLAYLYAEQGYNVLVIDTDDQGNATKSISGNDCNEFSGQGLYQAVKTMDLVPVENYIIETRYDNLYLLPASPELANIEELLKKINEENFTPPYEILKELIAPIKDAFDVIFIDTNADMMNMTKGALIAAEEVVIPVKVEGYTVDGCLKTISLVSNIKKKANKEINVAGIVLTMVDSRTWLAGEIKKTLIEQGYPVLESEIRMSHDVNLSNTVFQPVVVYKRRSGSTRDYINVAKELESKLFQTEG